MLPLHISILAYKTYEMCEFNRTFGFSWCFWRIQKALLNMAPRFGGYTTSGPQQRVLSSFMTSRGITGGGPPGQQTYLADRELAECCTLSASIPAMLSMSFLCRLSGEWCFFFLWPCCHVQSPFRLSLCPHITYCSPIHQRASFPLPALSLFITPSWALLWPVLWYSAQSLSSGLPDGQDQLILLLIITVLLLQMLVPSCQPKSVSFGTFFWLHKTYWPSDSACQMPLIFIVCVLLYVFFICFHLSSFCWCCYLWSVLLVIFMQNFCFVQIFQLLCSSVLEFSTLWHKKHHLFPTL